MTSPIRLLGAAAAVSGVAFTNAAHAAEYFVPSAATPDLQAAVDSAAASATVDDVISITSSPISTIEQVLFGATFGPDNQLVVRPDPAAGLERSTVLSLNPHQPIVYMLGAAVPPTSGYVTLQDLDLVRAPVGNDNHLVVINAYHATLERCRIGYEGTLPGTAGWSNVRITYPRDVTIRNCICFSLLPGTFQRGIFASSLDAYSTVRLYNNVVADHSLAGIRVEDGGVPGNLVLLRNNVVSCHPELDPDPVGYGSGVLVTPIVASHNVAFAAPGDEEVFLPAGSMSIAGFPDAALDPTFLSFVRPLVAAAFFEWVWDPTPPADENVDFFRLFPGPPLHDDFGDFGATVADGAPDPGDLAVTDDIEGDPRPSEVPPHTDRGADQIALLPSGVGAVSAPDPLLSVRSEQNPSDHVVLRFEARAAGRLTFELFDLAGRRLHSGERSVRTGETGCLPYDGTTSSQVLFYRVTLETESGARAKAAGRLVMVR